MSGEDTGQEGAHTSAGSYFGRLSITKKIQKQKPFKKIEWPAIYVNKN